ncbi:uncharacterized protein LOC128205777 [Mya arenaria]|uniref:uncharacterized protein LOC128205777 n=1 Tax=Mya arenaria TaxID=6604 RepID=UPI0022E8EBAD|nr:uncharacterized protein LOC128205777 [Mya arenaria]
MSSKKRKKKSGDDCFEKCKAKRRRANNWSYQDFDYVTIAKRAENTRGLSERLDRALDLTGYSPEIVKMRRDFQHCQDQKMNTQNSEFEILTVGSKGDGVSCLSESDTDLLMVAKKMIACFPDKRKYYFGQTRCVLLYRDNCQPGYLKVKRPRWNVSKDKDLLNADGCISSRKTKYLLYYILSMFNEEGATTEGVSGPAVTMNIFDSAIDFVLGFPHTNARILLTKWNQRHRKYEWPDKILRKKVMENHVCILPVGWKDRFRNETDAWHFSFVKGEKELFRSLKPAEYKLYVLLKRFNTQYLKPLCDSVSSYMMKNIVFWLVEVTPRGSINNGTLLEYFLEALTILRKHILDGSLKHFMNEDRNLMLNKWSSKMATVLITKIDFQKMPSIVFNLSKIGPALKSIESLPRRQIELIMRQRQRIEYLAFQVATEREPILEQRSFQAMLASIIDDHQIRQMMYSMFRTCWPEWLAYVEGVYDEDITSDVAESKALQEKRFPPKMLKDLSEVLVGHIIKDHCLSGDLLHDEHVKQRVLDVSDVLYIRMDRLST